jgi:hypothetical protein
VPLSDLDDDSLKWYAGALERSVNDPSKAKWAAKNRADLLDAQAELRGRFLL